MLHLRPNGSVIDGNLANDSRDGNALARFWLAVLLEVGVLIVFVVYWVAAALLLHRLAS
jgi:hypothetical protein